MATEQISVGTDWTQVALEGMLVQKVGPEEIYIKSAPTQPGSDDYTGMFIDNDDIQIFPKTSDDSAWYARVRKNKGALVVTAV
jgi:hypothetical protein